MRVLITLICCTVAAAHCADELRPFRAENSLWGFCRPAPVTAPRSHFDDMFPSFALSGKAVVPAQYRWVGYFRDSLARVTREGRFDPPYVGIFDAKWGYIDAAGREITPLQFTQAGDFYLGFARVEQNGKWGVLGKEGKLVVAAKYEKVRNICERRIAVRSKDGWGFCDDSGVEVIPCRYKQASDFYHGFARVKRDDKYAWLSPDGKELAYGRYQDLTPFDEDLAAVMRDNKWGYADTTGEVVIAAAWDGARRFAQGLAIVTRDKKQGYIDRSGTVVIEPQFLSAGEFGKDGLAVVQVAKESFAYIRRDGHIAFPQRFTVANAFHEGRASAVLDGKWYYIDLNGCMESPEFTGQFWKMTQAGEEPDEGEMELFSFDRE